MLDTHHANDQLRDRSPGRRGSARSAASGERSAIRPRYRIEVEEFVAPQTHRRPGPHPALGRHKVEALVRQSFQDLGRWQTSLRALANQLEDLDVRAKRAAVADAGIDADNLGVPAGENLHDVDVDSARRQLSKIDSGAMAGPGAASPWRLALHDKQHGSGTKTAFPTEPSSRRARRR